MLLVVCGIKLIYLVCCMHVIVRPFLENTCLIVIIKFELAPILSYTRKRL